MSISDSSSSDESVDSDTGYDPKTPADVEDIYNAFMISNLSFVTR